MADYPSSDARNRKQKNEFSLNISDGRSVYEKNQAKRKKIKDKTDAKLKERAKAKAPKKAIRAERRAARKAARKAGRKDILAAFSKKRKAKRAAKNVAKSKMKELKDKSTVKKSTVKKGKSNSRLGLAKRGKYGSNSGDGKSLINIKKPAKRTNKTGNVKKKVYPGVKGKKLVEDYDRQESYEVPDKKSKSVVTKKEKSKISKKTDSSGKSVKELAEKSKPKGKAVIDVNELRRKDAELKKKKAPKNKIVSFNMGGKTIKFK